jgi:hypothetical protein
MKYDIITKNDALEEFGVSEALYYDIIKAASASSAHPVVYEAGGVRFTVADLVMGRGSLKGGKRPDLSRAKPVSLADSEKWIRGG